MSASWKLSRRVVLVGVLATTVAPVGRSMAQQLIRIIVPFTASTGHDLLARILGEELRQRWNETAIVENKPGASGNIGTQAAARANPDGQIHILAVGSKVRAEQAPQVPTLVELGLRDFDVDLWFGVLAPAGTSKDIVDRYNAVFNEILAQP